MDVVKRSPEERINSLGFSDSVNFASLEMLVTFLFTTEMNQEN
jgi:hypothetical protein